MKKLKRVVLKISGEIFQGKTEIIDFEFLNLLALQLKDLKEAGFELILIPGGGNILRGKNAKLISREFADYIGMLSTVINSLALKDVLSKLNIKVNLQSSLYIDKITKPYLIEEALNELKTQKILIISTGTGYPYFTTDTAAALCALQLRADAILKATKVDGIYDKDPITNKNAKLYKQLTYLDVINKNLKVMDITAISLCMDGKVPIIVFNATRKDSIKNLLLGKEEVYTAVNF
jgi:uridylate kinase